MSSPSGKAGVSRDPAKSDAAGREVRTVANEAAAAQNPLARLQAGAGNQAVRALLGGGRPLPDSVRGEMEQRFGADFSQVRVHDRANVEAQVPAVARTAKAFTIGEDVAFGRVDFEPSSNMGKELLAHELTHVIQQRRGGSSETPDSYERNEKHADAVARSFSLGENFLNAQGRSAPTLAKAPPNGEPSGKDLSTQLDEFERDINQGPYNAAQKKGLLKILKQIRRTAEKNPLRAAEMLERLASGVEARKRPQSEDRLANPYSEVFQPTERETNEQPDPDFQTKNRADKKEKAWRGEEGAKERAREEGLRLRKFDPPQKYKGDFGEGIDSLATQGVGEARLEFILEGKFGKSQLGKHYSKEKEKPRRLEYVQMDNDWVGRKIAELQAVGDRNTAKRLLDAAAEGRLRGRVYRTREKDGEDVTTRRVGAYLRDKLANMEGIQDDGTIIYDPKAVIAAYDKRRKELETRNRTKYKAIRLPLNDGDNSLDPSKQPLPKKTEAAISKPPAAQPVPPNPEPSAPPKAVEKPPGKKLPTAQPVTGGGPGQSKPSTHSAGPTTTIQVVPPAASTKTGAAQAYENADLASDTFAATSQISPSERTLISNARSEKLAITKSGGAAAESFENADLRTRKLEGKLASVARVIGAAVTIGGEILNASDALSSGLEAQSMIVRGLASGGRVHTQYFESLLALQRRIENMERELKAFQGQLVDLPGLVFQNSRDEFETGKLEMHVSSWILYWSQVSEEMYATAQNINNALHNLPRQKEAFQLIQTDPALEATYALKGASSLEMANMYFFLVEFNDIKRTLEQTAGTLGSILGVLTQEIAFLQDWHQSLAASVEH
jgi:hypothetical protein